MVARGRYFANAVALDGQNVQVVPNTECTIYEAGTSTPLDGASIFAAASGGTTLGNPFDTDANGNILFYLANPRRVKIVATGVDVGPLTADYEPVLHDPADVLSQSKDAVIAFDGYTGSDYAVKVQPTRYSVMGVDITNGGTGYSNSFAVSFTGGGGSGAAGTATASAGVIQSVIITNEGSGYTSAPTPVFTLGGGSSGAGTALIGARAFRTRTPAGTTAFEVASLGGSGPYADLWASYHNSSVGPFVISNVRNWDVNSDWFLAIERLGSDALNSHNPGQITYVTASYPDGLGGFVDQVGINVDVFAINTASVWAPDQDHDGSTRAVEFQNLEWASANTGTMAVGTIGMHSANAKNNIVDVVLRGVSLTADDYGNAGWIIHTTSQNGLWAGWGTSQRINDGVLVIGNPGWWRGYTYLDTDNSLLFAADYLGQVWSKALLPVPGVSGLIGSASRFWTQAYLSTIITGNGSAANPSIAMFGAGASADGLFGSGSGGVIGMTTGSTEGLRVDSVRNVVMGNVPSGTFGAYATNATGGFPYIPSMAGTPSGTPSASYTGRVPMVFDTSASKLWVYTGGSWKGVVLA